MDRRTLLVGAAGAAAAAVVPTAAHAESSTAPAAASRPGSARPLTRFNVISDIQGDMGDLDVALQDMNATNPGSSGLAIAGDITPRGYDFEYAAVRTAFGKRSHPKTLAWSIGNHEFYVPKWKDPQTLAQETWPNGTTEDSLFRSFYNFAGRNTIYSEHSFGGIPVLSIGTEKYMKYHDSTLWDEVWMSEAQLTWLTQRLAYWERRRKPVMVVSHHPLTHSVSGTYSTIYERDYLQSDRLLSILGRHKDVFFFCGHTHWDLHLNDWCVRRVVPGTANPDGFSVINTGAIQTGYTDNGAGGEVPVSGPFNQGLQVEVYRSKVVILARDFHTGIWIKQATVPLLR
ncbi:DUF4073 domain-containing protein [Luteipulveratus mongoliensis]|uniref:Phosphohydrolase n=1 Tax=Luteipulveratus mongoliensis TaxID=571913 RepID=A0A0K1JFS6_9MICO|nr:DUF4073 domain-containing protein [Luteipulveratus mongoliensis]AKU15572.1 phosphohydrolase [Luteipulveratus mongoliensis]